jgi:chromosome segregation ATPase
MTYVSRSRHRNLTRLVKVEKSAPLVEERVEKRVDDRVKTYKASKLEKELNEKVKMMKIMTEKIHELEEENKQNNRIIPDLQKNLRETELARLESEKEVNDYKEKYHKMKIVKEKYKSRMREYKTECETLKKNIEKLDAEMAIIKANELKHRNFANDEMTKYRANAIKFKKNMDLGKKYKSVYEEERKKRKILLLKYSALQKKQGKIVCEVKVVEEKKKPEDPEITELRTVIKNIKKHRILDLKNIAREYNKKFDFVSEAGIKRFRLSTINELRDLIVKVLRERIEILDV